MFEKVCATLHSSGCAICTFNRDGDIWVKDGEYTCTGWCLVLQSAKDE